MSDIFYILSRYKNGILLWYNKVDMIIQCFYAVI